MSSSDRETAVRGTPHACRSGCTHGEVPSPAELAALLAWELGELDPERVERALLALRHGELRARRGVPAARARRAGHHRRARAVAHGGAETAVARSRARAWPRPPAAPRRHAATSSVAAPGCRWGSSPGERPLRRPPAPDRAARARPGDRRARRRQRARHDGGAAATRSPPSCSTPSSPATSAAETSPAVQIAACADAAVRRQGRCRAAPARGHVAPELVSLEDERRARRPGLHDALETCGASLGTDRPDIQGQRLVEVIAWLLAVPVATAQLNRTPVPDIGAANVLVWIGPEPPDGNGPSFGATPTRRRPARRHRRPPRAARRSRPPTHQTPRSRAEARREGSLRRRDRLGRPAHQPAGTRVRAARLTAPSCACSTSARTSAPARPRGLLPRTTARRRT